MQLQKFHTYFFNDNSIICWIPLRDRGVRYRFLRIRGKRVSPFRCFDGHNKNPMKCLSHGKPDPKFNFFFSPQAHPCAVKIWLKHLWLWLKTNWNSSFQLKIARCNSLHSYKDSLLFEYNIFVFLFVRQLFQLIFDYPCLHVSLPSIFKVIENFPTISPDHISPIKPVWLQQCK